MSDSFWRCFALRDGAGPWARPLTPYGYVLLVVDRLRLRRSERRYAREVRS